MYCWWRVIYRTRNWFAYLVLFAAVFGGASVPSFFNLYGDISATTKNLWRCQTNFLISLPFVFHTIRSQPESIDFRYIATFEGILPLLMSGIVFSLGSSTFIASAWLTISSHALIFSALAGVFIILARMSMWQEVHNLEKYGTLAVIIGCVFLMSDKYAQKANGQKASKLGDFLAIFTSVWYAMFFPLNKAIMQHIPGVMIYMWNSVTSGFWFILYTLFIQGISMSDFISRDPQVGLFGWISSEQWMICVFLVAPIWGFCCNGGYILSWKYFEPQILGNALLLEPMIGQSLGWLLGQDKIPGTLTLVGSVIILSGISFIIRGSSESLKLKAVSSESDQEIPIL